MKATKEFRIGTVFHETFALSRPAVASVLQAVQAWDRERTTLFDHLRENTTLGTRYCKAMPRYAQGSGLIDDKYRVTEFGRKVLENDPSLLSEVTQWLMHYHLSAPQGPGPLFWHGLVTRTLRPGRTLRSSEVAQELADILREQGQKEPTPRALQSTATIFLGTYARSDGLRALQVLQEEDGVYTVLHPDPPPQWVLAYTLADYWEHHWPGQVTVNLSDLTKAGGWASLFWMDSGTAGEQLQKLKLRGVVDLYRVAPPYQAVRLWQDKEVFLERAYARAGAEDD
ncbi:MAG: hypothetical protein KatS3mg022_2948 [Armatimonadota bacterium]|nr:MAG: hypothetical protein KatS3mg022_2948 [Armatimonadota bacterium]